MIIHNEIQWEKREAWLSTYIYTSKGWVRTQYLPMSIQWEILNENLNIFFLFIIFFLSFLKYYVHTKQEQQTKNSWQQNRSEINKKRTKTGRKKTNADADVAIFINYRSQFLSISSSYIHIHKVSIRCIRNKKKPNPKEIHHLHKWMITTNKTLCPCLPIDFDWYRSLVYIYVLVCLHLLLFTDILHYYVALVMNNHYNERKVAVLSHYLGNYSFDRMSKKR